MRRSQKMNRKEQLTKDLLENTLLQNIDTYKDCVIKLVVTESGLRIRLLESFEDNIDLILKGGKVIDVPDFYTEFKEACKMLHNTIIDDALEQGWDYEKAADNILNDKNIDLVYWIETDYTLIEIAMNTELRLEDLADQFLKEKEEDKEYEERKTKRNIEI
jgi:hypothetical protein